MKILFRNENIEFLELSEAHTRQYIEADSAWCALADLATADVRGSMMWRAQSA